MFLLANMHQQIYLFPGLVSNNLLYCHLHHTVLLLVFFTRGKGASNASPLTPMLLTANIVRGHLCAKCPLTNPVEPLHAAACLTCYASILPLRAAQVASVQVLARIPIRRPSVPGELLFPILSLTPLEI